MPEGCSTSQTTMFMTTKVSTECPMDEKQALWDSIYRSKERRTWTRSTNEISLTKDTVKRQDTIMDDLGERKQYSKTGIFGRIYQHSTTREQKAFTLNHHHTTTSDNSRLSKNTPRPRIRVLPEQNNTDIRSGARPAS